MWIALLPRPALAVTLEVGVGQTYPTVAQAVAAANSGDDILVHDGVYDEAFTVTFPLTLRASAGETVTLRSTNPNNGVVRVEAGAGNLVTLAGMNLDGDGGRVVYVATGGVALVDVGVTDTGGDRKGGAVWLTATGDSATLDRCDFDQSVVTGAMHHGAFVAADAGALTILGSTFTDGSTDEWGGAVFVNSAGTLTIRDSTFTSNQAKRGGAVYVQAGPQVEVTGSTFVDNSVQNDLGGGALYLQNAATTSVTDTVFRDNTANAGKGGAVYLQTAPAAEFVRCTFENNRATNSEGGAIYHATSIGLVLRHDTFCDNFAQQAGGAVAIGTGAATVQNSVFLANQAQNAQGGAVAVLGATGDMIVDHSSFGVSTSLNGGAALWTAAVGGAVVTESHFEGHTATAEVVDAPVLAAGSVDWCLFDDAITSVDTARFTTSNLTSQGSLITLSGSPACDPYLMSPPAGSPVLDSGQAGGTVGAFGGADPFPLPDVDRDGSRIPLDCDDSDPDIFPGAAEVAGDEADQDCDGHEDCFVDTDGDGWSTSVVIQSADLDCDDPGESPAGFARDCDDQLVDVNPDESEVVDNLLDDDCSGTFRCSLDDDGDGAPDLDDFTDDAVPCPPLDTTADDCDDDDPERSPAYVEVAGNDLDEDCDDDWDCLTDVDKDGWTVAIVIPGNDDDCDDGDEALASQSDDCDDSDGDIWPGAPDGAGDSIDQDCDGVDGQAVDNDYDGFAGATDCDDTDPYVNPAATEIPGDGADQNCDGVETCFEDADGDGARTGSFVVGSVSCTGPGEALASADPDCDDGNGSVYPNGTELAGNLLDDDCDTHWLCYVDADEDNARSQATAQGSAACSGPTDALESAPEDCDDLDPTVSPLVNERAGNLEDENCDGVIDCYADADFDGWTSTGVVASADGDCDDLGEGLRDVPPDCNDTDPAISPEAVEVVGDGVDQNCDTLDTPPPDLDGDGANASVDCDDLDSAVNPSAAEIAVDGRDQNCDGLEDCFADEDLDSIGSDSFVQSDDLDCDDPGESTISGDPCPDVQGVVCPDDTGHTGHTGMGHTGTGHTGTGHTGQTGSGHTGSGLHTGTDSTTAEHTGAGDTGVDDTAAPAPDPGCGCDVGGPRGAGWWLAGAAAVTVARRRLLRSGART